MLIQFFEKQINEWNENSKCGWCWDFSAPLKESDVNIQQSLLGKECCINVMLTRDRVTAFNTERTYDYRTGQLKDTWEVKNFHLIIVRDDQMDLNNYNEIRGHSTDNSKAVFLEQLEACISDMELDFCKYLGLDWHVSNWSATQLLDYQDKNYTGFRISVSLRKRKI